MLVHIVLVVIALLLCSPQSDAQLDDVEAPEVLEFDAVLRSASSCEGDEDYHYKMINPKIERISPDTVALSCEIEITMEIPDGPSYTLEALIENISEADQSERIVVATFTWPNICGELANEDNEGFRAFRDSVEGDFLCPVKKGIYKVVNLLLSVEDVKPLMREGIMVFTLKHMLDGKCFGCGVVEFAVTLE